MSKPSAQRAAEREQKAYKMLTSRQLRREWKVREMERILRGPVRVIFEEI